MKSKHLDLLKSLGVAVAAASVAPVLATAVSCATNNETRFDAIGGEFDREYNLSQSTYKALKSKFVSKVKAQLPPLVDRDMEILRLERSLDNIDRTYGSDGQYSYTLLSMMLVEKARKQYGVKLVTDSTAQLSDITEMYNGIRQSFEAYMDSIPSFDQEVKTKILNASQDKFHILLYGSKEQNVVGILEKYDDPLTALIQAKAKIITCFDEINNDIALVASANRLSQFLSDYTIMVKDDVHLDTLEQDDDFKPGIDLSDRVNNIFKIINNSTGDIVTWDPANLFPGYDIKPTLSNISKNANKNTYSLDVDWSCVKQEYKLNPKIELANATAHLCKEPSIDSANYIFPQTEDEAKDFKLSVHDLTKETNPISYHITLTPEGEKQALKDTYLDKLEFSWDTDKTKNAYEAFFEGNKVELANGKSNYRIASMALAASGLRVAVKSATANETSNPIRLDSLMSTSGIIGLSNATVATEADPNAVFIKQFLENCELESIAEIDESTSSQNGTHDVTNTLKVHYSNTKAINDDATVSLPEQETNGFNVSDHSYAYLVEVYNNLSKMLEPYESDFYEEQLNSVDEELSVTHLWFGLGSIMNTLCITGMIIKPWKGWTYWTMMALTILSQIGQSFDYGYLWVKHDKVHDFIDKLNQFKNSPEVVAFRNMLNEDKQNFNLVNAKKDETGLLIIDRDQFDINYNIYKDKDWDGPNGIKSITERYTNITKNEIYQNFVQKAEEAEVSPDDFTEQMKEYLPNGGYWWVSVALNIFSFVCDMGCLCIVTPPVPKQDKPETPEQATAEGLVGVDTIKTTDKVDGLIEEVPVQPTIEKITKNTQPKAHTFAQYDDGEVLSNFRDFRQKRDNIQEFHGYRYRVKEFDYSRVHDIDLNSDMMYYELCDMTVFKEAGLKAPTREEWDLIQPQNANLFRKAFSQSRVGEFAKVENYSSVFSKDGNIAELIIADDKAAETFAKNIEHAGTPSNVLLSDKILRGEYCHNNYDYAWCKEVYEEAMCPTKEGMAELNELKDSFRATLADLVKENEPGEVVRECNAQWHRLHEMLDRTTNPNDMRIIKNAMECMSTEMTQIISKALSEKSYWLHGAYMCSKYR